MPRPSAPPYPAIIKPGRHFLVPCDGGGVSRRRVESASCPTGHCRPITCRRPVDERGPHAPEQRPGAAGPAHRVFPPPRHHRLRRSDRPHGGHAARSGPRQALDHAGRVQGRPGVGPARSGAAGSAAGNVSRLGAIRARWRDGGGTRLRRPVPGDGPRALGLLRPLRWPGLDARRVLRGRGPRSSPSWHAARTSCSRAPSDETRCSGPWCS
jgi:hypothetical protein